MVIGLEYRDVPHGANPGDIDAEAVRQHLEQLLLSRCLGASDRLRQLLRYLVEHALSDGGARLKEYTIGVDVFKRGADYDPQVDSTVRVHTGKLRDKLREYYLTEGRDSSVRIELPKGSYVPVFHTHRHLPSDGAPPPQADAQLAGTEVARPARLPHRGWVLVLAVLTICTVLAFLLYRLTGHQATRGPGFRSIVVLPFRDISPQSDQAYFCDGVTEEIIATLSRIEGLAVVASTSAFAFKDKPQDVRAIASQLNVGTVLEGSIRKSGNHVRVTVQLIGAPDGYQLWSATYDRELTDVLRVQDEIAQSVANTLQVSLTRYKVLRSPKPQTTNIEAYNLYLQGRHRWYERTEAGLRSAIKYFEQAVRLDPAYARAYAGLADAYVQLDGWEFARPSDTMPKAREYVNKALALEPLLAEAYVSLGAIYETYDWDPDAARREYARAVALDPGYLTGHWWYAAWLDAAGQAPDAQREWEYALRLDPLSIPVLIDAAVSPALKESGAQDALALCRRAIDIDPAQSLSYRVMGNVLESVGRRQEAVLALEKAVTLAPEYPATLADLAEMRVRQGRRADALSILDRLLAMERTRYVPEYIFARLYFALGDERRAIDWLRVARRERSPRLGWFLIAGGKYRTWEYGWNINPAFKALVLKVLSESEQK
jgi:TolB-like protein/tetratricopeptide (TPR) repeat protein